MPELPEVETVRAQLAPVLSGRVLRSVTILDEADLVIAALGYRPRALPVFDHAGRPIRLFAETSPKAPLVDNRCRLLDEDRNPIPHAFAMGLAAGFVPTGKLGGEPSFQGQANGLWLWQSEVGGMIVDAVLTQASNANHELNSPAFTPTASTQSAREFEI